MRGDYKILNENITPAEPAVGLFDRIILAIKREKEIRQTRSLLFSFLSLLIVSFGAMPFSFIFFVEEWRASGIGYFISTSTSVAMSNMGVFINLWQDFFMSILEALPVFGVIIFAVNIALVLFTVRLFLYKKGLLLKFIYGR